MKACELSRRTVTAGIAAAPAAVALPAFASVGEDAELRELWAKYLAQLEAYRSVADAHRKRRHAMDAELGPILFGGHDRRTFERSWEKHGMKPLYDAWTREGRKLRRIVKAIRKAKAESLFGIGVKLSAVEDPAAIHEDDLADSIHDALRAIEGLTGIDFVADGGLVESFV